MIQRNRAGQDVRAGEVFVECTEKKGVRDFDFFAQGDSPVLQGLAGSETAPGGRTQFAGPEDGGLAYTE
jgi:hypothetical protein